MNRDERPLRYRIRRSPQAVREDNPLGYLLTVWDPKEDPQAESTVIEGIEFDTVADALHFVGVHYPNAHEEEE